MVTKQGFVLHATLVEKIQCTKQRNSRKRATDSTVPNRRLPSHPAKQCKRILVCITPPPEAVHRTRRAPARPGDVVRILHGLRCTSQPTTAERAPTRAHHLANARDERKERKMECSCAVQCTTNQPRRSFVRSFGAAFLNPSPLSLSLSLSCDVARSYLCMRVSSPLIRILK